MGFILFFMFVGIPILEISIFISIGGAIGLWPTLTTILATALIGSILIKKQGLKTLYSAQKQFNDGHLPLEDFFDGLCIIISGIFLITPGFLTDIIGILVLFPLFRSLLKKIISNVLMNKTNSRQFSSYQKTSQTIDGEFEQIQPSNKSKNGQELK